MARKAGQIVRSGTSTWLVRNYVGCDPETRERKYIRGPLREQMDTLLRQALDVAGLPTNRGRVELDADDLDGQSLLIQPSPPQETTTSAGRSRLNRERNLRSTLTLL